MMSEINEFDGSKQKIMIYQGHIHFLPNEDDDNEINKKQNQ